VQKLWTGFEHKEHNTLKKPVGGFYSWPILNEYEHKRITLRSANTAIRGFYAVKNFVVLSVVGKRYL